MTDVWTGTFTFLLTDIEGSTRMWEAAPADMARALVRHDDLISSIVPAHGGRLVRSRGEGDSAFAVFDDANAALACAVTLQRALHVEAWPPLAPIRVRMALHTGPAQARRGDFFGQGVNRAARLRSIAHGGQLLMSDDVHRKIERALPQGVWLTDLGLHRLKDLTRPERVWQIAGTDMLADFPPLRSLDASGNNLPVQLTAFVGRDMELLDVRKRLETSSLLTLNGPGGIGKTRLALQAAAESSEDFPDGVWLVELGGLSEPGRVAASIAAVLGVREQPGHDLVTSIADTVADRRMLLVLDTCEHVVDDCAHVVHELLKACKGLRILATSREPLRVYGEAIYAVPALALPDETTSFPEEAMAVESVRLFADRAALADREFTIASDIESVVRICRRLEGIPLALELAAALVHDAPLRSIAERLDDRLSSLAQGPRTAPERQQTLRGAIDWSYNLLDDDERHAYERLSVFAGGFTIDAAEAVTAGGSIDARRVATLVAGLVDRSLLVVREDGSEVRYTMLDTVREHASERLIARGEHAAVADRHLEWCASYLPEGSLLHGSEAARSMGRIDVEHDNVRVAMAWAISSGNEPASLRLLASLFYYWFIRAHFREGRAWLERMSEAFTDSTARGKYILRMGQLAAAQGDASAAAQLSEDAAKVARAAGDRQTLGAALTTIGTAAFQSGRLDEAKDAASEALTLLRPLQSAQAVVPTLNLLGIVADMQGDTGAARNYYEDALGLCREEQLRENIARLLMNLGNLALARSDYARAGDYYEEAHVEALAVGDVQTATGALTNLGVVAKMLGDNVRARALFDEALAEKRRIGDGRGLISVLQGLADLDRRESNVGDASERLAESLELSRDLPYLLGTIQGLETAASICTQLSGAATTGLRLAAAAEHARTTANYQRNPEDTIEFELALTSLRTDLDAGAASLAWDGGSMLEYAQATDEAIAFLRDADARVPKARTAE